MLRFAERIRLREPEEMEWVSSPGEAIAFLTGLNIRAYKVVSLPGNEQGIVASGNVYWGYSLIDFANQVAKRLYRRAAKIYKEWLGRVKAAKESAAERGDVEQWPFELCIGETLGDSTPQPLFEVETPTPDPDEFADIDDWEDQVMIPRVEEVARKFLKRWQTPEQYASTVVEKAVHEPGSIRYDVKDFW